MHVQVPCLCPAAPHDQDIVTLLPVLPFRASRRIQYQISLLSDDERSDIAGVLALLTESYVVAGVESWSLQDAEGDPLPVTPANIEAYLLTNPEAAELVADQADELYRDILLRPLLKAAQTLSRRGPTAGSTSVSKGSPATHRKRSRPSSISTIPTAGTEPISA